MDYKNSQSNLKDTSVNSNSKEVKKSLSSVIARSETAKQSQEMRFFSLQGRKANLLFFILILFLLTSFVVNADASVVNITTIQYEKVPDYTNITLGADGAISGFTTSYLEDLDKIVIEISNATFNINMIYSVEKANRDIALLSRSSVKKIECTQVTDKAPDVVKIIISLYKKVNYDIRLPDDKTLLYIDIEDSSEPEESEKQTTVSSLDETTMENNQESITYSTDTETVEPMEISSAEGIINIWYEKLPNYTHLTIKSSSVISDYNVFYLKNPERIVIDIHDAIYNIKEIVSNILLLNMGSVKQVRCGQFESKPLPITRFVIDLFQKADYEIKLSSDKKLLYVDVYDYLEFKEPGGEVSTTTLEEKEGEVEKIEKEEEPKISILDTYTEPINLKIFDEDVVNVIRALSEISGIDIMIDDSVTGTITLNFSDKTFREAIELILVNKGLDYTEVSNTLIIAAKDVIDGYKKPITRIFVLKNATAEGAKVILDGYKTEGANVNIVADVRMNTLIVKGTEEEIEKIEDLIVTIDDELLTRTFKIDNAIYKDEIEAIKNMLSVIVTEEGRINIDNRLNEIIVKGTKEELDNVETMIAGMDKRAPQIMIEAKVVEITLEGEKELGIKWTSGGVEGQISIGELTMGGSFERFELIEATLKALQSDGKTNILSNPKVLTLDGKEARIETGQQIPIRKITSDGVETIEYKKVGLTLTITPRVSSDGLVTMDVFPTVNSLGTELVQGYPVINSREENVIIRANLDETVVIGGLITSKDIKTITKIPLLGDIPIFGKLFQFSHTKKEKTEIIILITAHLLDY
jgi:type II secretory pathway component GspD/PulD (secretin)